MPSIPIAQAAFAFCTENSDFDTQRWDKLLAAIRDGFEFEDVRGNLIWGFNVDDTSYELHICDPFITVKPECGKTDSVYIIELLITVEEIEQAVADGCLDELAESVRDATKGEDASHE